MNHNEVAFSPVLDDTDKFVLNHTGGGDLIAVFDELVEHGHITPDYESLRYFVERPRKWADELAEIRQR